VIDWAAKPPKISDCRNTFDNLVDLSKRKPGCCTVSITPDDLKREVTLQKLIDKAVKKAQRVTVCLADGLYPLQEPLHLGAVHSGLTLESCGGRALLMADTGADLGPFAEGMIQLRDAEEVTLDGLSLRLPMVPLPGVTLEELLRNLKTALARSEAKTLLRNPFLCFGVQAYDAPGLTVTRCEFSIAKQESAADSDVLGAMIFLRGRCEAFRLTECELGSGLPATYNPIGDNSGFKDFVALDTELAAADQRVVDPKASDLAAADPKAADVKADELKAAKPKAAKSKAGDVKTADVKPADPKPVDAKPADPKSTDANPLSPSLPMPNPPTPKLRAPRPPSSNLRRCRSRTQLRRPPAAEPQSIRRCCSAAPRNSPPERVSWPCFRIAARRRSRHVNVR